MENSMKTLITGMVIVSCVLTGCSAKKLGLGQVAHQVITCTSDIECKTMLAEDCPNGGVLHGIKQAVQIEYSCNQ